jgi:Fe-S-cluster containining protein
LSRSGWRKENAWWQDGLQFTCIEGCGKCCDEPGGIVNLSVEDAKRLAQHFEMTTSDWLERDCVRKLDGKWVLRSKKSDGICIYLDNDMSCTVYSAKPNQCSAFPWWGENLRSERTWKKTARTCPGLEIHEAPIIPGEIISKWVEADRHSSKGFRHLPE